MHLHRFLVPALLAIPCLAQEQAGAKALFHDPTSGVTVQSSNAPVRRPPGRPTAPIPVAAAAAKEGDVTGLRYWIELQTGQGQLLRVNSSRLFRSGERIRLHFESNVDGSLVILQSQDTGPFTTLFPTKTSSGRVEKFKPQVFPSANGWFRFDAKPGDIRLLVMVQGDQGRPGTQQVASAAQSGRLSEQEEKQLEARMRTQIELLKGSKALVVEDDSSSAEPASYVVADSRKSSQAEKGTVAVEIKLNHR